MAGSACIVSVASMSPEAHPVETFCEQSTHSKKNIEKSRRPSTIPVKSAQSQSADSFSRRIDDLGRYECPWTSATMMSHLTICHCEQLFDANASTSAALNNSIEHSSTNVTNLSPPAAATCASAKYDQACPLYRRTESSGVNIRMQAAARVFELDAVSWFFSTLVPLARVLRPIGFVELNLCEPFAFSRTSHRRFAVLKLWISALLCCTLCVHGVTATDFSVSVDPSIGRDTLECNLTLPCQTITYAIHTRRATDVLLSSGSFGEPSVHVNSSVPFLKIYGSRDATIFDCSRRLSRVVGPAFIVTNASISISGITFQNCVNLNSFSGTGGAISADSSIVSVTDCTFLDNVAQIGGAIGAISGALTVVTTSFRNNSVTCPNATFACSAWGGAIGVVEAVSVNTMNSSFHQNSVNLELIGVKDADSRAAGGGGCISIMYNADISGSRIVIDGNVFQNCTVRMSGSNLNTSRTGVQHGNTFGGAVSIYFGFRSASSLQLLNVTSSFVNNRCFSSTVAANVGIGGNSYGGCLSVYAGAWNMGPKYSFNDTWVFVENVRMDISSNIMENCSASVTRTGVASSVFVNSANVYGGGISLVLGAYSYMTSAGSVSGGTTVSSSSYVISKNTMTSCTASSFTSMLSAVPGSIFSNGANVYGGGMSLAVGAYSYVPSAGSVSGGTTVNSSSFSISSNTLTSCTASSSTSSLSLVSSVESNGANVYGGGISLAVGAYSYVPSAGSVSGGTTVNSSSFSISSNTLTFCSASSSTSSPSQFLNIGANVYGGGMSLAVGAYSYMTSTGSVSGGTTVSSSSLTLSSNTLTFCTASSSASRPTLTKSYIGLNVHGGGISLLVGTYSYIASTGSVSGGATVSSSSYTISSNTLNSCTASSSFISSNIKSVTLCLGANVYGGGISLVVGSYSFMQSSQSSPGSVSGGTTVIKSNYTISRNTINSCNASSSISISGSPSNRGSNAYGGGIALVVGAYLWTSFAVSEGTTVSSSSLDISNNVVHSCTALSSTSSTNPVSVFHGANVYGGGVSLMLGAYSFQCGDYLLTESAVSHSTVNNSSCTILSNIMTSCTASSFLSRPSVSTFYIGLNVYGGGISLAVGAYSYMTSAGSVSGGTTVSSSSYVISNNTLTSCTASSSTKIVLPTASSSVSAINTYGGGIALVMGALSFIKPAFFLFPILGATAINNSSFTISSNVLQFCTALSSTTGFGDDALYAISSNGANVYGGGISLLIGAYLNLLIEKSDDKFSTSTAVSNSICTISSNTLTSCTASSSTSSSLFSRSNGANVYGGGISLAVGAYSYVPSAASPVSGGTTVNSSSFSISSNTLTSCTASSSTSSLSLVSSVESNGANVYGGGMSLAVGAYSYMTSTGSVSGGTTVSSSSLTLSSNTLISCSASSSTSSLFSSTSNGANVYGGGISLAVGAYSYVPSAGSVSGGTTVSSSSLTLSSNTLTFCTALSSTSSSSISFSSTSNGANVHGGGISLVVGAYSYTKSKFVSFSDFSFILEFRVAFLESSILNCSCDSVATGNSKQAFSFGGAISTTFEAYVYPNRVLHAGTSFAMTQSSLLNISRCKFMNSFALSSPTICSPGTSNAAGGALFVSIQNADAFISHVAIINSTTKTRCVASSSMTFSMGGGIAVYRAGKVIIDANNVTQCVAEGVFQANNIFASGGGIFVQDSLSVTLKNSFITSSSVDKAFSVLLMCGGGAFATRNVSEVQISNSKFYNNSDSTSRGIILLQQMESHMGVNISDSVLSTNPSISLSLPVLNMFCGFNCSIEQQQRLYLNVTNSNLLAQCPSESGQLHQCMVLSLPRRTLLSAADSFINCSFNENENIAVIGTHDAEQSILVSCAPCSRPFFIARTSRSMNLNLFSSFAEQTGVSDSCRSLTMLSTGKTSNQMQQCPYGVSFCSTIANVTVGFWTKFTADGNIIEAVRCPSNYCGCRNIKDYKGLTCQIFPPFAVEFQPEDALCSGNRTGVLCGGCKPNFTHSLNGHSCVHNDLCSEALPLVWTITVVGYVIYSVYIVISSAKKNTGLILCVLFYGQLSLFSSLPSQLDDDFQNSEENSAWFSRVSQFGSILSLYDRSCYGVNMGAYEATAAQLCGPFIVLVVSLTFAAAAKRLLPKFSDILQKHKLDIRVSFSATLMNVLQLLFSSVIKVVFELITCQDVGSERRVFVDGTRKCEGQAHESLIAIAVILSNAPLVFLILLKFNKIPAHAQSALCSQYVDSRSYWGMMTLFFRFVATVIFATVREFPSMSALALLICSLSMLILLIILMPYAEKRTYYMDIFCNFCLVIQFALQILVRNSESLGVAVGDANRFRFTLRSATTASNVLRYIPFVVCAVLILLEFVLYRLWRLGLNTGRFVRKRVAANGSIDLGPVEDPKNDLL